TFSCFFFFFFFFFSSRRRHTRSLRDWSSDVCSSDLEVYTLKWRTDQFTLDASKTYRIRVLVFGNYELGHADVDVVNSGSQLKNVQTGQFIPLLDGRTLPIKFRIETGAVPPARIALDPASVSFAAVVSGPNPLPKS